jgi:hypothetical protein
MGQSGYSAVTQRPYMREMIFGARAATIGPVDPDPDLTLHFDFANNRSMKAIKGNVTLAHTRTTWATERNTDDFVNQKLLHASDLTNAAWTTTDNTVVPNTSETLDPKGTNQAEKVTHTGTTPISQTANNPDLKHFIISHYVKVAAGSSVQWIRLQSDATNGGRAWFDVVNGVVGATTVLGTGLTVRAFITNIGNGWFRIAVVARNASGVTTGTLSIAAVTANSSTTLLTDQPFYLWLGLLSEGDILHDPLVHARLNTTSRQWWKPVMAFSPHNLLLHAIAFDNAYWTKTSTTVTPNVVRAPDGEMTADQFTHTASPGSISRADVVTEQTLPLFVQAYFKAGDANTIFCIQTDDDNGARAWFDVATGTVLSSAAIGTGEVLATPEIFDHGDGWFRCSVIARNGANADPRYFLATADGSTTAKTGGVSYIWGGLLGHGAEPWSPIDIGNAGLLTAGAVFYKQTHDVGMFNRQLGYRAQKQRTNSALWSEDLTNPVWVDQNGGPTRTANTHLGPLGLMTLDTLTDSDGAAYRGIKQTVVCANSETWVLSAFVAKNENTANFGAVSLEFAGGTTALFNSCYVDYRMGRGIFRTTSVTLSSDAAFYVEDWGLFWRYVVVGTNNATGNTSVLAALFPAGLTSWGSGSPVSSVTGAGTFGGIQLEKLTAATEPKYASGYMPTRGSTQVRTADDIANNAAMQWYNPTKGTFLVKYKLQLNTAGTHAVNAADSVTGLLDRHVMSHSAGGGNPSYTVQVGGVSTANQSSATHPGIHLGEFIAAGSYRENSFHHHANGSQTAAEDTAGAIPTDITQTSWLKRADNTLPSYYWLTEMKYWRVQKTAAELNVLTRPPPDLDWNPALTKTLTDSSGLITFPVGRTTTGTRVNSAGVLVTAAINEPRFTHDPVTRVSKGIMFEPSRTQLFTWSTDLTHTNWDFSTNAARVASTAIAPDGTQGAFEVTDPGTGFYAISQTKTVSANSTHSLSLWILKDTNQVRFHEFQMLFTGSAAQSYAVQFNSQTGAINERLTTTASRLTRVVNWGNWWRLEMWATDSGSNTSLEARLHPAMTTVFGSTETDAAGTGTWYGPQLESGKDPSSYIATAGATLQRTQDIMTPITDPTLLRKFNYGITATWVVEGTSIGNHATTMTLLRADDVQTTSTYRRSMQINSTGTIGILNRINGADDVNAVTTGSPHAVAGFGARFAGAGRFAFNNTRVAERGTLSTADTVNAVPYSAFKRFTIGAESNAANPAFAIIERVRIWADYGFADNGLQSFV